MSYVVLARKYRPQTFDELVGQDAVQRSLGNAIRSNKIHHAYLFTGTRGIGKTTIARIFAKCLNCETHGITDQPCGTCSACTEIQEGRFVDLIEIDAASRTKVEDTLTILENVKYAPTRGRYKIYLIDEVHMLSMHSFNALLKTLEEPPEHVKFLLATTDPQKLPITVLSRCLQYNLRKMSAQDIKQHLISVLEQEHIGFEEGGLELIAKAADGSMRDALSITDQAISYTESNITQSAMTTMLGLVQNQTIFPLIEALIAENGEALIANLRELAQSVPDFLELNQKLIGLLHQIALFQQLPDALDKSEQLDYQRIEALSADLRPEQVQLYYQIALNGHQDIAKAPDKQVAFEMLLLRMLVFLPEKHAQQRSSAQAGSVKKLQAGDARPLQHEQQKAAIELSREPSSEHSKEQPSQQIPEPSYEQGYEQESKQPTIEAKQAKADREQVQRAKSEQQQSVEQKSPEQKGAEPKSADKAGVDQMMVASAASHSDSMVQAEAQKTAQEPAQETGQVNHSSEMIGSENAQPVQRVVATYADSVSFESYFGVEAQLWLERWWQLVRELSLEQKAFNFVAMTVVDKIEPGKLTLVMLQDDDVWYEELHLQALKVALARRFGADIEVLIRWVAQLPEKNLRQYQLQLEQVKQAELEQLFLNDPVVRYAIDELGGVVDRKSIQAIDKKHV